jgi:hypothetical protein
MRIVDALVGVIAKSLLSIVLCSGAIALLHGGFEPLLRFGGLLREMIPFGSYSNIQPGPPRSEGPSVAL